MERNDYHLMKSDFEKKYYGYEKKKQKENVKEAFKRKPFSPKSNKTLK